MATLKSLRTSTARPAAPEPAVRVSEDFETEFPDGSALATESFSNLVYASERGLAQISRHLARRYGLSVAASLVLATVEGAGGPLTPKAIGEHLLITSGSVTSVLDTLEGRGLIRRRPHPSDGRSRLVEVTDPARELLDQLLPEVHAFQREAMAHLDPREQRSLVRLLAKVQQRLAEVADEPPFAARARRPTGV